MPNKKIEPFKKFFSLETIWGEMTGGMSFAQFKGKYYESEKKDRKRPPTLTEEEERQVYDALVELHLEFSEKLETLRVELGIEG